MVAPNVQTQGIPGSYSVFSGKFQAAVEQNGSFEQLLNNKKEITAAKPEKKEQSGTLPADGKTETKVPEKVQNPEDGSKAADMDSIQTEENVQEVLEPSEEEAAEKVGALVTQILETVKELLELTDEELNGMLEQLGLKETDLLNPEQLKLFYLNVKGEPDASALLTDASLLEGFRELTKAVEVLAEQSGVSLEELAELTASPEFMELLQSVMADAEENAEPEQTVTTELPEQEAAESVTTEETTETKAVTLEFKTETQTESGQPETAAKAEQDVTAEVPQAEQFLQNLQTAAGKIEPVDGQESIVSQIREIADQILEKVKVIVAPETTSLEIQLTPVELGKVNLTVTEQDGVLKAKFLTENEVAKEAIESNLIQFKETLNAQGLKVESIEVMVSDFAFDKNSEAGQSEQEGSKKGKQRFVMEEDETADGPDSLAQHFMEGGESTVNYMA